MINIPRIVIAGTNSGCGKTTITAGIMAALVKRGLKVQPFKVGPDYIDPMYHTFVTGRHSRNLDGWMLEEDVVSHLFIKNSTSADIAVIEGVMGFYDGFGGYSATGSTAHVSKLIKAPVILVINGEGSSLSIAALVKGFKEFDADTYIRGVIINNIKSQGHYDLLKEIIEENTGVTAVGYLLKSDAYSLTSRHLGLVPSDEIKGLKEKNDLLAAEVEKTIDLELLTKIAGDAEALENKFPYIFDTKYNDLDRKPRIAVARDKAFNFYYKDNLDLLETLGADLVYFSPVDDKELPDNIDGLYIGGGYPEVWAKELEDNTSMRIDIKGAIGNGLPSYAECGGFMYMTGSIKDTSGNIHEMVGIIPGKSEMTSSLKRFGYVELDIAGETALTESPAKVRAHEFHYSTTEIDEDLKVCYKVSKSKRTGKALSWECGYKMHNLLAGYPHIHFWANPSLAEGFVNNCILYRNQRDGHSLFR